MAGKGISDAVRKSISTWITDDLARLLWEGAGQSEGTNWTAGQFRRRLQQGDEWKRDTRRRHPSGIGWYRPYRCKLISNVALAVETNEADTAILYVKFFSAGKLVGGGTVNVPSVYFERGWTDRQVRNATFTETTTPAFKPFTPQEIAELQTNLEYGDASIFDRMMEECG